MRASLKVLTVSAAAFLSVVSPALAIGGAAPAAVPKHVDPKDFSIELAVKSATWVKQAGSLDLYTLTLTGVPQFSTVRTAWPSKKTTKDRFAVKYLSAYWFYGERTGQFTSGGKAADGPLAVITTAGSNRVALAKLHILKSSSPSEFVFSARVLPDTALARKVIRKIAGTYSLKDRVNLITALNTPGGPIAQPRLIIDMPKRAALPAKAKASGQIGRSNPIAHASMNCYGTISSYLAACAQGNIGPSSDNGEADEDSCPGLTGFNNVYTQIWGNQSIYWYYQGIGIVTSQFLSTGFNTDDGWACNIPGEVAGWPLSNTPLIQGPSEWDIGWGYQSGDDYGIDSNWVTYIASSRCSAFIASWASSGSCY